MKFKDIIESYLLTEGRTKRISKAKTKELILNNCQDMLEMHTPLYRGKRHSPLYGHINPKDFSRGWNEENFLYNMVIDNSSQWSQFPKREFGVVCTTHRRASEEYGTPHYVFPYDNANIGICQNTDIWYSFHHSISASAFTRAIDEAIYAIYSEPLQMHNWSYIKNKLQTTSKEDIMKLDEYMFKGMTYNKVLTIKRLWRNNYGNANNLYDLVLEFINPREFKLTTPKEANWSDNTAPREIWTDSECVIVECEAWDNEGVI